MKGVNSSLSWGTMICLLNEQMESNLLNLFRNGMIIILLFYYNAIFSTNLLSILKYKNSLFTESNGLNCAADLDDKSKFITVNSIYSRQLFHTDRPLKQWPSLMSQK